MIYYYLLLFSINQSIGNYHLGGCVSASVYQQDTTQEFQTCEGESYSRTISPLQLNNWYYFVVSVSDVSRDDAQFTLDISQYSKSFIWFNQSIEWEFFLSGLSIICSPISWLIYFTLLDSPIIGDHPEPAIGHAHVHPFFFLPLLFIAGKIESYVTHHISGKHPTHSFLSFFPSFKLALICCCCCNRKRQCKKQQQMKQQQQREQQQEQQHAVVDLQVFADQQQQQQPPQGYFYYPAPPQNMAYPFVPQAYIPMQQMIVSAPPATNEHL